MNSGSMPDYAYRPTNNIDAYPDIRSTSLIRARLFNSTYFRAKEPGIAGNKISIAAFPTGNAGLLVVTNHNTINEESVVSDEKIEFTMLSTDQLVYSDLITVTVESGNKLNIKTYTRTFTGVNTATTILQTESVFDARYVVSVGTKCMFKLAGTHEVGTAFTIQPRLQIHPLKKITVTDPKTPVSYSGWDPQSVRQLVQQRAAVDGWIEMMPRGFDIRDTTLGEPEYVFESFPDTYLTSGGGFSPTPSNEVTGPTRSIVHVNYSERYDGSLGTANRMYEWAGSDSTNGYWRDLHA